MWQIEHISSFVSGTETKLYEGCIWGFRVERFSTCGEEDACASKEVGT